MKSSLLISLSLACSFVLSAAGQQTTMGQWQNGPNLPFFPVHMHALPNGKLIIWPGDGGVSGNDPRLLDPISGVVTPLAAPGYDVFCSGHSLLPDGRLFVSGGHISNNVGLPSSTIYDPASNAWIRQQDMNLGRWYPSDQVLPNGDVLVVSGDVDVSTGNNPLPQVWQASTGTWRSLVNAQLQLGLYPTLSIAPNGSVFVSGPSIVTRSLDTSGTGTWTTVGNHVFQGVRDYDGMVMYQPGKVLVAGGSDPPTNTAEVIDLNAASPAWRAVSSMANARRQMNATMLPDGKVLVTGGTGGGGFNNSTTAIFAAEEWDPVTELWTTMASATFPRLYHSIAMLLPDARVLVTGGNGYTQSEIYSPPYLFAGARPTISSAPTDVANGASVFIGTPDAANITSVAWVRLPSETHGLSMSQGFFNSANITQSSGGISISAPSDVSLPAGYYMLFLLNHGVPSVARTLHLGSTTQTYPTPTATSLSPAIAHNGDAPFVLTVSGSNFSPLSLVNWNGAARGTTFVSSTQLKAAIPAADLASPATIQVTVSTPAPGGGLSAPLSFTIQQAATPNLTQTGTIIAKITAPTGGGNHNLEVIRDGDMPPVGTNDPKRQFDTYSGGAPSTEDWIGYQYSSMQTFAQVVFQEGMNFSDGGWFNNLKVQVRQSGTWVDVASLASSPVYPPNDGTSYETYTLSFSPISGDAIRIDGSPGGSSYFMSVGELQVYGPTNSTQSPALSSLSPSIASSGGAPFNLTVNGTNFASGYTVQWNGSSRPTTFVSSTQLTAAIPAADITTAGTAQVTVLNPASGGGSTSPLTFTVSQSMPAPALSSLSPSTASSGGAPFTLTVNGTNFASGYNVQWNGASRPTTFVSSNKLTAAIPAADIAAAGTAQVTVLNPASGGRSSSPLAFTISQSTPALTLSSISPATAVSGGGPFTLTVNGTNFASGYTVQWNGSSRQTTFTSSTQLTAAIPATDIATAGTAQVTVLNPASGGGSPSPLAFTISQGTVSDLTQVGTIIAKITTPTGGGNHNLQVIRDGDMPAVGTNDSSRQYDTYSGGAVSTDDWIGYQYPATETFSKVVFQEGMNFSDGGWFNNLNVQVRQSGTWVNVANLTSTPTYPPNDGISYETYTLTFSQISGDAIRIVGAPGGSSYFISVGELLVYGTAAPAPVPTLASMSSTTASNGDAPFKLTVTGTNFGGASTVQWNGSSRTTTFVSPTQLIASIPASDLASVGTAQVTVFNPPPGGAISSALAFTITQAAVPNFTQTGTIIARVTSPTGGGNHNLEVIRDGDKPPVGAADSSRQYDTYSGGAPAADDWIGYQYATPQTFGKVVFQEGRNFVDGGWFNNLNVQVRQSGTWVSVANLTSAPVYPPNDGTSFETYTLSFTPVTGDAIRIEGVPGGSSYFISVGELEVYGH